MVKHAETHPALDVDGCYGCKIAGVRLGGLARMKQEREAGVTQSQLGRETVEAAQTTGQPIQRVGKGSRWI